MTRVIGTILCGLIPAAAGLTQKTPDTRIDHVPTGSGQVGSKVVRSAGDRVYVVWTDSRDGSGDIRFNRSVDAGETWLSADLRLDTDPPGSASSSYPSMWAEGDRVVVVWEDRRNGARDIYFNRSTDAGATWLANDVRIDTDLPGAAQSIYPVVRGAGSSVYVVWSDARHGDSKIYLRRSTDGGETWDPSDARIDNTAPGIYCYSPVPYAEGTHAHVVWRDNRSGVLDVFYNRSTDSGATWGASNVRLDTDPLPNNSFAPLITGSGPNVYVVWGDNRDGVSDVYFNRSTDRGLTWLASDIRLDSSTPGASVSEERHIACNGRDVHVVWSDWRAGRKDIFYNRSRDAGATWLAADVRIENDPPGANHSGPAYVVCAGEQVYVAWEDTRNGNEDIYFNRSPDAGTTWLATDVRLDTDPPGADDSWAPRMAVSGTQPFVIWGDRRPDNYEKVYFNIPLGFQHYGLGKVGSAGLVPQLTGNGLAVIGSDVSLIAWSGVGGAPGALLWGGGPGARTAVPFQGGTILVAFLLSTPLSLSGPAGVAGVGSQAVLLSIPDDPAIIGTNLNFQAVLLDADAPFGLSMTNALEMWIG